MSNSPLCVLQLGEDTFNRAKLLNVGYTEALKDAEYDCFIFSDIDLIPMDDRNLYHCYDQPRHFAIAMDKFGFRWWNEIQFHHSFVWNTDSPHMVLFVRWTLYMSCQLQLLLYIILLCCKYIEFKSASSCLTEFPLQPLFWQTIVKEQCLIWVNLIILWIPCLQP